MKTLEQLFGWILFSLSVLMVYGLLAMFFIGPTHAREEPTFAQMNDFHLDFLDHLFDGGVDAPETTDDSNIPALDLFEVLNHLFGAEPTFAQMPPTTSPDGDVDRTTEVENAETGREPTMWRMDGTWCGPYPVDPTQTVCKTQTIAELYSSEALCLGDIPEKQKEGYTDISCERTDY